MLVASRFRGEVDLIGEYTRGMGVQEGVSIESLLGGGVLAVK